MILDALHKLPLLQGLSRHYVQKLADLFKSKKIKRGQYLYKENDEASELYLIQDGEFRISKKISLTIKSKLFTQNSKLKFKNHNSNTSLASLGKGELIGEEEILSDETIRSTTCQCSSDFATVMIISKENFLKYILITDEGKELIKARNLSKQGSRQAILENALKLQKINVGLIQVNVEDTPIKTKSLWTPSSIHSRNSSLLTFTHRVANLTPRPQGPDNFFERPKTPSNYLGYKYLKAEKYRIRRKIQDDVRNIHRQKPLFSGPFTSVPNLPKQEKVSIVNIQNYERKFEIDD